MIGARVDQRVSPDVREKVIQDLAEHFAHDRLTLPEYERRVEQAWRASSADSLRDLLRDLAPTPPVPLTSAGSAAVREDAPVPHPTTTRVKYFAALMSGVVRRGTWRAPARMRAIACMGGVSLDLRDALLAGPVTEIQVVAVMGGVEIIVPPDVRLESDGFAVMGGFEDQLREPASGDPNAPVVRVRGLAVMGGVETRVAERNPTGD